MSHRAYFDKLAQRRPGLRRYQRYYRQQIQRLLGHHIARGSRVLEWGCGDGELLTSLAPVRGLGLDFSPAMVSAARDCHAQNGLEFREGDIDTLRIEEQFDAIVLDDLCRYLPDVEQAFTNLRRASMPHTRLYITSLNALWRPIHAMARVLGLTAPKPAGNWLSTRDLQNLLELAGWQVVTSGTEQLLPLHIPLLSTLCNRFLVHLPLLRHLGSSIFMVARPQLKPTLDGELSCSVVVPARNEAGHIRSILERVPVLGDTTELIFVEGHSQDDTWEAIQREIAAYQGPLQLRALRQSGIGKWDAVSTGFAAARGAVLVIQDADLTAPPEDLPKFYAALAAGRAEFANGSRMVYPMEGEAMRFLNMLGNKFFAELLSFIMAQPVKDSLCGTKMLLRSDYLRLRERIRSFGDFDPFGDFNLLFGAALLDLHIRDIPVRYRARLYGETNISRFRHGWLLLRMCLFGLRRIRFFR